jgi:GNAT superfamily N-acetyltransferase
MTWLASVDGMPVGMLNMAVFERMPRPMKPVGIGPQPALSSPGRLKSEWGYIANVFVLESYRNQGVGRLLLDAAIAHARAEGYARLVLSPTDRAVPFYLRAGFGPADELLLLPL